MNDVALQEMHMAALKEALGVDELDLSISEEATNIMHMLKQRVFIIEHEAQDKKTYRAMIEQFYNYIKAGFEHEEFRTHPVYFKLFDRENEFVHTLELRHMIINLMLWEPLVRLGRYEDITENHIMDARTVSVKTLKKYIDNTIVIPYRKEYSHTKLNKIIHDLMHNLSRISFDFSLIMGMSVNMETFIKVANESEEFNQIIRTKIDENMQPIEIEAQLDGLMRRQIEILGEVSNMLQPILNSGTGIKSKQLTEFAINGGMKPDLFDNTIPIPINTNFIVGGLNTVTNYYLDATGGRKSAIMNKTVMGRSGHFARTVMLSATDTKLDKKKGRCEDCGTIRPVKITLRTKAHLEKMIGRWYRPMHHRTYKVLLSSDTHLIGETLFFRAPQTCANDKICMKCYGELYHTNRDLKSVGGYAGTQVTNPISQAVLSSKHLLTTQSEEIKFNADFNDFFTIKMNEILLNAENEDKDFERYSMVIIKENIQTIEQFDDTDFNSYVIAFHIKDRKSGEMIEIKEQNHMEMFLSHDLREIVASDRSSREYVEIRLGSLSFEEPLFAMEVNNNELTKPLYSIMHILNREDHEGCRTIDEVTQRLLDLIIESNFSVDSIHMETLLKPLMRSTEDLLARPDFRDMVGMNQYRILTVDSALQNHPSVLVSLAYQELVRQLMRPITFRKRGESFIDPFFKERP